MEQTWRGVTSALDVKKQNNETVISWFINSTITRATTKKNPPQPMNLLLQSSPPFKFPQLWNWKQDGTLWSSAPATLYTLCYHGMFKCSEWKPALALLITRNALSGCPSKTWVLKTMPSRSHKACELFVLPVQPVCLCSSFRGRAKLSVLKRGRGCVKKKKNGRRKGWRKSRLFWETLFELRSTGTVL